MGTAAHNPRRACEPLRNGRLVLTATAALNCVVLCAPALPLLQGRIFCGGRDGNLYELTYSNASGWRGGRRCQKIAVSGMLSRLVPSVLKLWPADPATLALAQVRSQIGLYHLP